MAQIAWEYYLKKVQEIVDRYQPKTILKTDANNEAFDHPKEGGITGNIKGDAIFEQIEYNQNTIDIAKEKVDCNIIQGDIRKLPYEADKFDMVLDLSTIDHVRSLDVPTVLKEYYRVAKNGGLIFLVIWCARDQKDVSDGEAWDPDGQYHFWYEDIRAQLKTMGTILEEENIWEVNEIYETTPGGMYILKYVLVRIAH